MLIPPEETVNLFKRTPGAMSVCEMIAIHSITAQALDEGVFCSMGSHAGKDTIAAVSGMTKNGKYYLIDPCYDLSNTRAWSQAVQKEAKQMPWHYVNDPNFNELVKERVKAANPLTEPVLIGEASLDALPLIVAEDGFKGFSYVFSDSDDHNYNLMKSEDDFLEPYMLKGGIICFHDYGNYSAPVQIHKELIESGLYENVAIPWNEIQLYVSDNNLEEGNDSWHCCQVKLPCFLAAVRKL